ncbi:PREDICTED: nuclear export mediator factor NEMF-like [Priapulus caudatus]|uniref:Nuclear export mediator factor NEMF-like n=1 Tax=Priapulus caudatus TaxID=37621 RepID=A0ABM1ERY6_PRICU|nr:PREDICTED: nuclear export mediator factor NEMF-like [Priapulus caudatus]
MKTRFNTLDIRASITELNSRLVGLRVINVYDVDHKTYLIRLGTGNDKATLLLESGSRVHSTEYDWPKSMMPSGFAMKLRKHLKSRRLESIHQLGIDRIVDMQFGSGEAAYHVILELYDRGNIVLTDFEYTTLNILRPRTDQAEDVKFVVRERYPVESAKQAGPVPSQERLREILLSAKPGELLKKVLNPHLPCGPAVIDHCIIKAGFVQNAKIGKDFDIDCDIPRLTELVEEAECILTDAGCHMGTGFIIQKKDKITNPGGGQQELLTYFEFHPQLFKQHCSAPYIEFPTFNKACDEFFSQLEGQRLDLKAFEQEKAAMKKLENVKRDHEKRLEALGKAQEEDDIKGQLIEMNQTQVDGAIKVVRSAIANQIDWTEINSIIHEAQMQGDPIAAMIKKVKLEINHISMLLRDPFDDGTEADKEAENYIKPRMVDIDLYLTAYGNARKYYDQRRTAKQKEQKTIESSEKAVKSATKKTKQMLKDVAMVASINKARKTYWFEKFFWFISTENYVVIGGRDQQQNEIIVKKYLRPGDIYVHADLHGASSVIVKNPSGAPILPKTLNEAGTMAICYSLAWDAKVVTSAWWVYHDQVSKTAPTGEYLTTGSFMVRGKKNYLPPSHLIMGFGFMFKLDESCIENHKGERSARLANEESVASTEINTDADEPIEIVEGSDSESEVEDTNRVECEETLENERSSSQSESNDDEVNEPSPDELQHRNDVERNDKLGIDDEAKHPESLRNTDAITSDSVDTVSAGETAEQGEEEEEEEEVGLFPDTNIQLQHVKGDIFQLQRSVSGGSMPDGSHEQGDGAGLPAVTDSSKQRLSAKQRRDLKKKRTESKPSHDSETRDGGGEESQQKSKGQQESHSRTTKPQQEQQQQPKRGKKAKQKKIKEKYGDQDSAGPTKEPKKKIKGGGKNESHQPKKGPNVKVKLAGISGEIIHVEEEANVIVTQEKIPVPTEPATETDELGETTDQPSPAEAVDLLDSLTGCPLADDILLFAVPVCAPYSAMSNYKHKVKLIPGNNKRGKAAKTAIAMFSRDRETMTREKDLFKGVKDADVSRNIPGKVKMSAPNLHKAKGKK